LCKKSSPWREEVKAGPAEESQGRKNSEAAAMRVYLMAFSSRFTAIATLL